VSSDRFIDLYLDEQIPGWPCYSVPRFSTTITANATGGEKPNQNWAHPLHEFRLPKSIRYHAQIEALHDHWLIVRARKHTFPFRDPLDFASRHLELPNVIPAYEGDDQALMVGDGATRDAQLYKTYERGGFTYTRPIYFPVTDSIVVLINGMLPEDVPGISGGPYTWTITRPGGVVRFTPAPANGLVCTWGGLFDVECRFERDDTYGGIIENFQVSGFSDLTLIETRRC
jgi:uncharacterized protein (TIGR02217 family)